MNEALLGKLLEGSAKRLAEMHEAIFGPSRQRLTKARLAEDLAQVLSFKDQAGFDRFFELLTPVAREAIRIGVFSRYVSVGSLGAEYAGTAVRTAKDYYEIPFTIEAKTGLGLFVPISQDHIRLPPFLRELFLPYIPRPEGYEPAPLSEEPTEAIWSCAEAIDEFLPLLVDGLARAAADRNYDELARKGLLKSGIKALRAACGLKPFPLAQELGLESIELAARLIAALSSGFPSRPADPAAFARDLVKTFMHDEQRGRILTRGSYVELYCLSDHISRKQGNFIYPEYQAPAGRTAFLALIEEIAKKGGWYSLEALEKAALMRNARYSAVAEHEEVLYLAIKADFIEVGEYDIESNYDGRIIPYGIAQEEIIDKPLIRAYCYALAVLGILDIAEKAPKQPVWKDDKRKPVSPYDCIAAIRVSEFGQWCLGLRAERPAPRERIYEAIADKELLLVAFRGESLEHRLYLESIAERLGPERYRVSETSFSAGCAAPADVERRIADFKRLIDPAPSPRWEAFFAGAMARAMAFQHPESALLFDIPEAARAALEKDPRLDGLLIRAEGGRAVVRRADLSKLAKILSSAGFVVPNAAGQGTKPGR